MIDVFLIKLILSFFIGSIWITITTIAAEKFGTKIGGIIGGLPTTMLVALFFIGWIQSPEIASEATTIIPIVAGFNCLFIVIYTLLLRVNLPLAIIGSLTVWLILSTISLMTNFNDHLFSILGYLFLFLISYYTLEIKLKIKSRGKIKVSHSFHRILFRVLFSGSMIAFAVLMSKLGGPLLGGIFSTFPAAFLSTLIIIYKEHGKSFSVAIGKTLMIGGSSTFVYSIAIRYFYISLGLIFGTILAFVFSILYSFLIFNFVIRKLY